MASPANENENRPSLIASSGTPAILTILHISNVKIVQKIKVLNIVQIVISNQKIFIKIMKYIYAMVKGYAIVETASI